MNQIGLILAMSLVIAACTGGSKKSPNTAYYNLGGEPTTLSPLSGSDAYTSAVHEYLFEGLLRNNPDTYEWEPALAVSWEISKDKKHFDFTLREGVTWHDGTPFTAEDVKYSYDVIWTDDWKSVQYRPYYEAIKEVTILAPNKVRFTVGDDYFQNFDIAATLKILPKHFYSNPENKEKLGREVIGTGPYKLTTYSRGQRLVLDKNETWWGNSVYEKENTIPKLVLRFVSEENVSLELLKKGDLDFLTLRPEGFAKKTDGPIWEKRIVKVKTENKTPKGYSFIGFNMENPKFKDRDVRMALSMLFNRQMMNEKFEYSLSTPATGPIYVQSDYANPDVKPIVYNPEGALELLRKAGWSDSDSDGILDKVIDGKKVSLSFTIMEPAPEMMKYLTVFKEDARKVGVDVNMKNIEWNSFIKLLDERNFEAVRLAWSGGGVDWDPKQVWHSSSANNTGSNFIGYKNPKVDKLIDEARQNYNRAERIKMLREVHKLIADDAPYIFFFNPQYTLYGHSKRMQKPKDTFQYAIGQQFWTIEK
ncbi:MAG TPA: ABC transporter substrate-binding protein [Bacteriovoracaceae bacterium]|nr:ABC transporter substrate-binding protein [Bacteriovoracaceae bacterium]